jgi:hypothetical protein
MTYQTTQFSTNMPAYDYPEHYAKSFRSALQLAERLMKSGDYDLFRGQRHTYAIQPSIFRQGVDVNEAKRRLNAFAAWTSSTPDLSSLHGNATALLAVAQHYGLKTPLLDFTRSPRVAAFFATDGGIDGDTGTIICLNRKRFIESWNDMNLRHVQDAGNLLTEIIDIDVNNLWRLQAQEGVFLRCHVDPTLLEMFSCFLHIYFPQKSGTAVKHKDAIYPQNKSHLEVLLDQFFLIESYPERERQLEQIFGHAITISEESVNKEIEAFYKGQKLPTEDCSWRTDFACKWMKEPEEGYHDHGPAAKAQLRLSTTSPLPDFEMTIAKQLVPIFKATRKEKLLPRLSWSVVNECGKELYADQEGITTEKDSEFTEFSVAEMIDAIYSGMRYLPYKQAQISRAIVRYLTMLTFGVYDVIHSCEGVEFEGGGVRGRGFASRGRIVESLRDDFFNLIEPAKLNSSGGLDFRDLIFAASRVKVSYDFNRFLNMFVEDLIPSQAVIAVEGLVIGLNPMRIEVFGES